MRYLIFSVFTHLSLFSLLFLSGWGLSSGPENPEKVVVDVLIVPPSSSTAATHPQRPKKTEARSSTKSEPTPTEPAPLGETEKRESPVTASVAQSLTYVQELQAFLEKNKSYPKTALRLRHSGVVQLRLVIAPDGTFSHVEILNPSPFETLNGAALQLVSGLKAFKPLPSDFKGDGEFIVPIAYRLKGSTL